MIQPDITVISYDIPHRKTQDVLFQLKAKGYTKVYVLALPFVVRKSFTPLYKHRPSKVIDINLSNLCANLGYAYLKTNIDKLSFSLSELDSDYILIAGAGLLPNEVVKKYNIINTHPGWLPNVRGLDALKWAIHHKEIIGVSSHFIDTETDAGTLIEQRKIPVYANDSFHSLAYRQYETEIEMLVNTIELIPNIINFKSLQQDFYTANMRMPKEIEKNLLSDFNEYLTLFTEKNNNSS